MRRAGTTFPNARAAGPRGPDGSRGLGLFVRASTDAPTLFRICGASPGCPGRWGDDRDEYSNNTQYQGVLSEALAFLVAAEEGTSR